MYSKCNDRKIMIDVDTEKVIRELFNLLLHKHQMDLEELKEGSNYMFDYFDEQFYK